MDPGCRGDLHPHQIFVLQGSSKIAPLGRQNLSFFDVFSEAGGERFPQFVLFGNEQESEAQVQRKWDYFLSFYSQF